MPEKENKSKENKRGMLAWLVSLSPVTFRSLIILLSLFFLAWIIAFLLIIFAITYIVDSPSELAQIMLLSLALIVGGATFTTVAWSVHRYYKPANKMPEENERLKPSKIDSLISGAYLYLCLFVVLAIGLAALAFLSVIFIPPIVDHYSHDPNFNHPYNLSDKFGEILIFSLALIGASTTIAISLWRGKQINEQIDKAQRQIEETRNQAETTQQQLKQARFQSALEMATEKERAGRCASGLRILANIYEKIEKKGDEKTDEERLDQQTIHSVALYVLSLEKGEKSLEEDEKLVEKAEKRVSSTARQWALDILVRGRFLSYKAHIDNEEKKRFGKAGNDGMELSIKDSTIKKDFSRLYIARQSIDKGTKKRKTLNLSKFSFNNCDFSNADISGVNLSDANLYNANLENTQMFGVNLSRARLRNVRGLTVDYLDWTYCTKQPQIEVFGWQKWLHTVEFKIEDAGDSPPRTPPRMLFKNRSQNVTTITEQDFLIQLTYAAMAITPYKSEPIVIKRTPSDLDVWKILTLSAEKPSSEGGEKFWDDMTQDVWEYLRYLTGKIDVGANQLTIDPSSIIKPWKEWKDFINEKSHYSSDIMRKEVWDYMKQLADEGADYPPGVGGDDE